MKFLLTGGCGFLGSNIALKLLREGHEVLNLDKLTYAANTSGFESFKNYALLKLDIAKLWDGSWPSQDSKKHIKSFKPDYLIHLAAESMVDRSLANNRIFFESNVLGTWAILELLKITPVTKAIFFSTDETYGSFELENYEITNPNFGFSTDSKLDPRNPYAGSKAAADQVTLSYIHNFGLPICIVRPTNNYGPRQHLEKFIPKTITNILNNIKVPVYGNGRYYREWIYVEDTCRAVQTILEAGQVGSIYNIGQGERFSNLEIIESICQILGKNKDEIIKYITDRPGHDKAYAVNSSTTRKLGWTPQIKSLSEGLQLTVDFYKNEVFLQNRK